MRGIWPILFAYFDASGRLDRDAMRRQVESAIAWGAPGIAVLGVATEVGKLSVDERRSVIRWAAEDIAGRVPLAVTIAGETVAAQRELADYAVAQGAGFLILQPPPAAARGEIDAAGCEAFFSDVMRGQPVPVGIQNAPEYLGFGLSPEAIVRLADRRPEFRILKGEASSVIIERTIAAVGDRLAVLNGRGGLELLENLEAGCAGMIVAPDNADHQHAIHAALAAGRADEALERYRQVLPAIVFAMQSLDTLICYGKRIAAWRMGFEVEHDRAPALGPTEFGLRMAREHARRLGPLPPTEATPATRMAERASGAEGAAHDQSGADRAS
ncbi:dihydrodipicolinate synthase family protein [Burkholderiaceae bacterium FT117]|uniref:dihydrodipicolinate synthase family protein n=1 Tax=Zeimonas sediminis TaxID=2944268 RepID=UPI002342E78F|nr:dihydrodipicolinate synthase family protein [Zeimonas sediminis]MCM5570734.1 dihydrodipicolinate synthase family protein [Zeimonas sediminis]